jgi:hypothetical protein
MRPLLWPRAHLRPMAGLSNLISNPEVSRFRLRSRQLVQNHLCPNFLLLRSAHQTRITGISPESRPVPEDEVYSLNEMN